MKLEVRFMSLELQKVQEEKDKLQREMQLLNKQYAFYNQFHYNESLGNAIAYLIGEIEGIRCVCKKLVCEIPEHKELVKRKLPDMPKKQLVPKRFSRKVYTYIAIMKEEVAQEKVQFSTAIEMKNFLNQTCLAYTDHFGILNPQDLEIHFPYLKIFFHLLNEWRFQTGRATLDDEVIENVLDAVIHHFIVQHSYMHSSITR